MRKIRLPRGWWLAALGVIMIVIALIGLAPSPAILQYTVASPIEMPQPDDNKEGSELRLSFEAWADTVEAELKDGLSVASVCARSYGYAIMSDADASADATLTGVGERWFSVYPKYLSAGRLITDQESKDAARVAVLDESLAFKLFPTGDPLEGKVKVGEKWYSVIGTIRKTRGVGDSELYAMYVPINCLANDGIQTELIEASGVPIPRSGASKMFEESSRAWRAGGTFTDVEKEAMGATMILRIMAIIFGFYLIFFIMRIVNARLKEQAAIFKQRLRVEYFIKMLPGVLLRTFMFIVSYAALIAAGYALLTLAIDPMYVFTEWIPDVIVEMSSITERFWQLVTAAAKPVNYQSHELSVIRFWGGILRWGVILTLCGGTLMRRGKKPE